MEDIKKEITELKAEIKALKSNGLTDGIVARIQALEDKINALEDKKKENPPVEETEIASENPHDPKDEEDFI